MRRVPSFLVFGVVIAAFLLASCADSMNEQFSPGNRFVSEGEPTENQGSAAEETYSVCKAATTVSAYNSAMADNISVGWLSYHFSLTASDAEILRKRFPFTETELTRSQVESYLSGAGSDYITSFLESDYAWLAYVQSSSDVRILLKMPPEETAQSW